MLTMKDIIREGHPTLRTVAAPLSFPLKESERQLAADMAEFLRNSQDETLAERYQLRAGVGIAAPQLNHAIQMLAVLVPAEYEEEPPVLEVVMINPKITRHSVQQSCLRNGEGCLSVDREVPGIVPRHARITVHYYDLDGVAHTIKLKGFPAIVVQHEIDHLNGIMFYDHINSDNPSDTTNMVVID